jgi:hypothetical protein
LSQINAAATLIHFVGSLLAGIAEARQRRSARNRRSRSQRQAVKRRKDRMEYAARKIVTGAKIWASVLAALSIGGMAPISSAYADEANAKRLVKAMSDYLASQKVISIDYDSNLEIVTTQKQKLALTSSGTVVLSRPDKIHATRTGGFANVELVFDGSTLTLLGKNANAYTQVEAPGTIDQLVDDLRDKYHRPMPAADLLMSDVYNQLMPLVVDAKDLGSGVIRGVECDHLAFRTKEVDWQIWIAQGDRPYPCRYVITSPEIAGTPQYTIDVRAWKTQAEVAADEFRLTVDADAKKIAASDLPDFDELPTVFAVKR